ncbi:hypothetical protein [Sulfitobacter guttiformis]|uniref:hypothetical protein n=1 Tax=Sulfitobacter guttiformis TaxID=74349 RepID=UPI00055C0D55|nr:hypothetical protein [Sulfitobacter guttiformis]
MILVSLIGISGVVMPVSLITRNTDLSPAVIAVYGSIRSGKADLKGGYQLEWHSSAGVLWLPHLRTEFVLEGADSRVTGTLRTGLRGIKARDVAGRAGPGLAQLVEGAWLCDMTARLSDVNFGWYWRSAQASGLVSTPQGTCSKDGRQITVPSLTLVLGQVERDASLVLTGAQEAALATVRVRRERRIDIEILPAAADVFPQLPRGGPINLQLPF